MKIGLRGTTALATAATVLAPLTACTSEEEPKQPSLAEATRVLTNDGQKIMRLLNAQPDEVQIDDKSNVDDRAGCPDDTARRRYTMTIELESVTNMRESLEAHMLYGNRRVRQAGYQHQRDANRKDSMGFDVFASTWRKESAKVSFTVKAQAESADRAIGTISGQTDCLR